jgi:hypothetical protein
VGVTTRVRADADEDRSERELQQKRRQSGLAASGAAKADCCGARNLEPSAGRCRGELERREARRRLLCDCRAVLCCGSSAARECAGARLLVQTACAGLALAGRLFGRTGGAGRLSVLVRRRVRNKFAAEISVAVNVGEGDVLGPMGAEAL